MCGGKNQFEPGSMIIKHKPKQIDACYWVKPHVNRFPFYACILMDRLISLSVILTINNINTMTIQSINSRTETQNLPLAYVNQSLISVIVNRLANPCNL